MSHRDVTSSLRVFETDEVAAHILAALGENEVADAASALAATDPYGERARLSAAVRRLDLPETAVSAFIEHQLWCTWRQSRWITGRMTERHMPIMLRDRRHLLETQGHPTILITPMTVALADASLVLRSIAREFNDKRQVIAYGEGLAVDDLPDGAGMGLSAARRIAHCLAGDGLYCSYADFVYAGHRGVETTVFGTTRLISSSLAGLASREGTMLLPCLVRREPDILSVEFGEPTLIEHDAELSTVSMPDGQSWAKVAVAELIGNMLEALITRASHQWLLLPTLSFEAPQMVERLSAKPEQAAVLHRGTTTDLQPSASNGPPIRL